MNLSREAKRDLQRLLDFLAQGERTNREIVEAGFSLATAYLAARLGLVDCYFDVRDNAHTNVWYLVSRQPRLL